MKIYFACSITGGRDDEAVYRRIVDALLSAGHEVPTALLAGPDVMELESIVDPQEVYTRDTGWIEESAALVAEVSTPSHGVGYEIGYALQRGKKVLCLHRAEVPVSKMITGNRSPGLSVFAYDNAEEAIRHLQNWLGNALENEPT